MRLIHTADLHLGFRAYERMTRAGLNQRELDIAQVFRAMVAQWIELRPDVVCIAGDLFDKSRPTNHAINVAMEQFTKLRRALPDTIVAIASGNHDQPKTNDSTSILPLFSLIGIHVAERQAKRLTFPDRELAILLVPDSAPVALEPDPRFRHNVLVIHGGLEDVTPMAARGKRARLTASDLDADRWGYVAIGDYHVHRSFAPNCCYSGSMEYTSTNIWGERTEETERGLPGKGFVEFDLTTNSRTFHPITPARPVHDLPPIDAREGDAAAVSAAIARQAEEVPGGIDGAIVRQVILNCSAALSREIDSKSIRELKARAMHYQADPRRPERMARVPGTRAATQRLSIEDLLRAKLAQNRVSDEAIAAGMDYYEQASQAETLKVAAVEAPLTPERQSEAA